jgi:hypothetical protein
MDYSDYPFRHCAVCQGLGECPEPEVLEDGFGTVVYPEGCPKRKEKEREEIKKQ